MPRFYDITLKKNEISISEVDEKGKFLDDVQPPVDLERFRWGNNITTETTDVATGKKFSSKRVVIHDEDLFETCNMKLIYNNKNKLIGIEYEKLR